MPTTTYVDSTFSANVIGARTDSAGAAVTDFTSEEARFIGNLLSEGYIPPTGSFRVQAQASPDMTVKVGSGTAKADYYVVAGEVAGQGNYIVRLDVANQNVTIDPADASQARTDEIYLVVRDNVYDASSRALPQIGYRKGDLGGAAPGPDGAWEASAKLATIAVAAAATTITSGVITDNRTASLNSVPANLQLALEAFFALAMSLRQTGDANSRFELYGDGYMKWGDGTAALDTVLYRAAANSLKTDDSLTVGGTVFVGDPDTSLYRGGANILKTDDEFQASALGIANNMGFIGGPVVTKVDALRMRINAALDLFGNLDLRSGDSIFWNSDTNLYRSAASILKTDDEFQAAVLAAATIIGFIGGPNITKADATRMSVNSNLTVTGDVDLRSADRIWWNSDTYLRRSDVDELACSDLLVEGACAVAADLTVLGVKNFRIDHPQDPDRYLVHSCTESPRNGVEYWGTATVAGGRAEVELPHYFEALTRAEDRAVHLTVVAGDAMEVIPPVAATRVEDGKFRIITSGAGPASFEVVWQVKAVRADVRVLEVEPLKPVAD